MPQTLLYSVMLLYFDAAGGLLALMGIPLGGSSYWWLGPLGVLVSVGAYAFGGLGIANGYRIGWQVGVAVACGALVLPAIALLNGWSLGPGYLITLLFNIALVVLLLHPQSRSYQRIWFEGGANRPRRR